jgi:hypothetical protein
VMGGVLGRLADQPGERDQRGGRDNEESDVPDAEPVEHDDERPQGEEAIEHFAEHAAVTLTLRS